MPLADVFTSDIFSLRTQTDAVNRLPYVPGRAGELGLFEERGIATTTIMVEEKDGVLNLLVTTPRGGVPVQYAPNKRTARSFTVPHIALEHTMVADEVQGVRAFGSESQLETVQGVVGMRLGEMVQSMDATMEYLKVGALKGIVLDGDGATTIYNYFTEFGVTQETEVAFDLTAGAPASGTLGRKCAAIIRKMQDNLGAAPMSGVHAFCSPEFYDDFIAHSEVLNSYLRFPTTAPAQFARDSHVRTPPFSWGGIDWEEYRGSIGGTSFIAADKAIFFPKGVPGLYKMYFSPADFQETVNTIGLPRYAPPPVVDPEFGRWVKLHLQSNPLPLVTRPKVLMIGRRGA